MICGYVDQRMCVHILSDVAARLAQAVVVWSNGKAGVTVCEESVCNFKWGKADQPVMTKLVWCMLEMIECFLMHADAT